jgi:hypothetical protein
MYRSTTQIVKRNASGSANWASWNCSCGLFRTRMDDADAVLVWGLLPVAVRTPSGSDNDKQLNNI